jgi:predicted nucleic acid-binding protein
VIVISDASPISHLHQIGRLGILKTLYGRILIPPAVEMELRAATMLHAGIDWSMIEVVAPRDSNAVAALLGELDPGESEAIVIAVELRADLLLIDEAAGRDVAKRYRLRRTGTLGVLLDA